ncbi:hypothetical protein F0U60_26770 [Archangium minus]|uniref:Uncharacterized protein n=1 Tax=Archangium minus TaxID=83450 RepID=A0ABY9WV30_9BACT|nr:hypothetical protein F0U60_26770 [Archangium minus]
MHPLARTGVALALLLSTATLAASKQIPQVAGPPPGAPIGAGLNADNGMPVSSTTGGGSPSLSGTRMQPTLDAMSAFAQWWGPLRGNLSERIRGVCTNLQSTPEVASWCTRYHGPNATEFDAATLLDSDALVLAAYFSAREPLLQALASMESALATVKLSKSSPQAQQDELAATQGVLDLASSRLSLNAGVETAASLAGLLPGIELSAFLDQLFKGLALALQDRAEAEAVLYVLLEFDERICAREVKDTWGQMRGHIRDWLPSTCTAAHNNVFAASLGAGGTASLALLRKTVEEDLRAIPSHLAFEVVFEADGRKYARAAPAVRELVDAMIGGVHPVRALDTLSRRLEALPLEPGVPATVSKLYTRLACVSAMPGSFTRYIELVNDANRGLVPQMDSRARGLAVMLLSLQRESCGWVYEPIGTQSRLKVWAALAAPLSESAEGIATVSTDLQQLVEQARRLGAVSQDGTPAQIAEATRLLAQEGVSALDAADVALDGVLRLNRLLGGWMPNSNLQVEENQKALLEARTVLLASRDVLRMVVAAIARDITTVYQLLLEHQAISSRTSRYGDEAASRCNQAEVWKAPAMTEPEAQASEWRCERRPCICLPDGFTRYGGLLVALADAKDAEEVKAVILASTTPVGSWRWRSDPDVHHFVSLSGMVGFGGAYYLSGAPGGDPFKPRVLVPFGVDYQLGRAGLTWSLFFQAIDLAGYTNFVGMEERKAPRVAEAISPGLWLKGMFPRTPFTLSVSAAYDLDAGGVTPHPAWRVNAGVSIDMPLFLLYRN